MRLRRACSTLLAFVAVAFLMGSDGLDEEEYHCEEAVKHLLDCCPGFSRESVSCYAYRGGCDGDKPPDLVDDRAVCLRDASCQALVQSGACASPTSASCD
jgi:hypothetical protein